MKRTTMSRIGGVAAAFALAATMTGCSMLGGQSVADACKIANEEITKASSSVSSDLSDAMQNATSGEKVDFEGLFAPVQKGLDEAQKKVTNETVKVPLSAFAKQFKTFTTSFAGFEVPDLKSLDPTDPTAMDKITEAQKKIEEISTKTQAESSKLQDLSKKLQDVCTKG
ncbi:MAG: hypothetical protein JSS74_05515 [Actinobacteria bacterium]|nr:hypothetical protein [Actinomycetota bacterium]